MDINVTRPSMPGYEEYIQEIRGLWESGWLTNSGVKHKQLEDALKIYLDVPYVTLFANGHLALETAIAALGITGEVITTPFTFVSTTHAIVRNGLTPVFCDINPENYTIDVDQIESLINENTSAIVPVHVYGNVCNIQDIERIAEKYNLAVVYDAAHAFGVEVDGVGVGNFGNASMFSFHATKVFNTIEGGAVTYRDPQMKPSLCSLKNFGIVQTESVQHVGGNAKMNEFQAAMGICNLRHVNEDIQKRRVLTERYMSQLGGVPGLKFPKQRPNCRGNYSYFPVVFDGYQKTRDEVFAKLKDHGIFARKYFYPLTCRLGCYREKSHPDVPVAEYIAERVLTLPLYDKLALDDVDRICEMIKR